MNHLQFLILLQPLLVYINLELHYLPSIQSSHVVVAPLGIKMSEKRSSYQLFKKVLESTRAQKYLKQLVTL